MMNVLVRVDVGRIISDEPSEDVELALDLLLHGLRVVHVEFIDQHPLPAIHSVGRFPEIDVEPEAQVRVSATVGCCLASCRPPHHEARARHDPVLVRLCDALVDAVAEPEVVGVDDQGPPSILAQPVTSRGLERSVTRISYATPNLVPRTVSSAWRRKPTLRKRSRYVSISQGQSRWSFSAPYVLAIRKLPPSRVAAKSSAASQPMSNIE